MTLKEAVLIAFYESKIPMTGSMVYDFIQDCFPCKTAEKNTVRARITELEEIGILVKGHKYQSHRKREWLYSLSQYGIETVEKLRLE